MEKDRLEIKLKLLVVKLTNLQAYFSVESDGIFFVLAGKIKEGGIICCHFHCRACPPTPHWSGVK